MKHWLPTTRPGARRIIGAALAGTAALLVLAGAAAATARPGPLAVPGGLRAAGPLAAAPRVFLPYLRRPPANPDQPVELALRYQLDGAAWDLVAQGERVYGGRGPHLASWRLGAEGLELMGRGEPLPGDLFGLDAGDGLVFAAAGPAGLLVLSLAEPDAPALIGRVGLPGVALDVARTGPIVAVAAGTAGLQMVDVADPRRPRPLGAFRAQGEARAVVAAPGGYVFLLDRLAPSILGEPQGAVWAIDVRDPAAPRPAARLDLAANGLRLDGERLLVFRDDAETVVVDVRDPAAPGPPRQLSITGRWLLRGETAFVLTEWDVRVLDVANEDHPVSLGRLSLPEEFRRPANMLLAGDWLLLALPGDEAADAEGRPPGAGPGLASVNVAMPWAPRLVDRPTPTTLAVGCTLFGAQLACPHTTSASELQFVDLTPAGRAATTAIRRVDGSDSDRVVELAAFGDDLVALTTNLNLALLRPSGTDRLERVGTMYLYNAPNPGALRVDGHRAFIAAGGLTAVDLTDPTDLRNLGAVEGLPEPWDYAVEDGLAVILSEDGIVVADVSQAPAAMLLSQPKVPFTARHVALSGGYAFIGGDGPLAVLDLRRPAAPVQVALSLFDDLVVGPLVLGGRFLYSHGTGITAIDVSHPAAPRLAATFGAPVSGAAPELAARVPALWPTTDALFAVLEDPATLRTVSVVIELPR